MNELLTILKVFEYLVWGGVGLSIIAVLWFTESREKRWFRKTGRPMDPGDWWKSDDEK